MKNVQLFGILGFIAMAIAIAYAMVVSDFFAEARAMIKLPWFHLSMIDLYAGFLIFSGWILYRERSRGVALLWIVFMLALGNLTSFLYILLAARASHGDWGAFWMGARQRNEFGTGKNTRGE